MIRAYVRANGHLRFKRFPVGTPLEAIRHWHLDTRASLELTQRTAGTLAGDIEPHPGRSPTGRGSSRNAANSADGAPHGSATSAATP